MAAVSNAASTVNKAIQTATGAFGKLSSDDFVKVMMSELKNQDPFNPQDSAKLLEQLSSLRNIESQLSLEKSLGSLVLQNQISSAGGVIGKVVEGLTDDNNRVSGLVTSVRVADSKVYLELDSGNTIAMDKVSKVSPAPTN